MIEADAKLVPGRRVKKGEPGAVKVTKESSKWYGRVPGRSTPVALSENKRSAERILDQQVGQAAEHGHGLKEIGQHDRRPLAAYLEEWEAMLPKGDRRPKPKHVRSLVGCVRRVVDGCDFAYVANLDSEAVREFLAQHRTYVVGVVLPEGQQEFRKGELAELLQVKPSSIPFLVARHKLPAVGNGKARRYPRETADALVERGGRGAGEKTSNMYLAATKQFIRWLSDAKRLSLPPAAEQILAIKPGNPAADPRHERTSPLTIDEFARLVAATELSETTFRGLTGPDRAMLYRLAVETGYRAEE